MNVLEGVEGIAICRLTDKDVVRHELVQRIIRAYDAYDAKKKRGGASGTVRRYKRKADIHHD